MIDLLLIPVVWILLVIRFLMWPAVVVWEFVGLILYDTGYVKPKYWMKE